MKIPVEIPDGKKHWHQVSSQFSADAAIIRRPKIKNPWSDVKDYFVSEFTFAPTAWIWVEFTDGKRVRFDFTSIGRRGFRHLLYHLSRNVKTNVPAGMVKIAPGSKKPVRLKRLRDVLRW